LHQAAHHAPPAYHAARARALPLDCTFVAARAALPASRVADLVPGDVVLFADTPAARRGSIPGWLAVGRYACAARLDRTATGRQVTVTNEVTPMSSLSPASTAPGADVLEHLPVTLSVTLGTVTLSAADVTRLAPGAVIELATPLAGPVEVHAGARAIATGELVEVDGALGVRLLQLLP
jgi:type III secretion protein Q